MTTTEQDVIRQLLATPAARELVAEREADALAVRRAKVTTLRCLEAAHLKALSALQAATSAAAESVTAAQAALRQAQTEHGEVYGKERAAVSAFNRARDSLTADLLATADPAIDTFLRELSTEHERTRRTPISNVGGVPDGRGGFTEVRSNGPAVLAKLAVCNAARLAAALLSLEALTPDEVGKKLTALRRQIEAVR